MDEQQVAASQMNQDILSAAVDCSDTLARGAVAERSAGFGQSEVLGPIRLNREDRSTDDPGAQISRDDLHFRQFRHCFRIGEPTPAKKCRARDP